MCKRMSHVDYFDVVALHGLLQNLQMNWRQIPNLGLALLVIYSYNGIRYLAHSQ